MRGSALLARSLLFDRLVTLLRLVLGQAAFLVLLSTAAWTGIIRPVFSIAVNARRQASDAGATVNSWARCEPTAT
jgi:hypothetical protein